MKTLCHALSLMLLMTSVACGKQPPKAAARVVKGMVTNNGGFKFVRGPLELQMDGSTTVTLQYLNGTTGRVVANRTITISKDAGKPVVDGSSSEALGTTPAALAAAEAAYEEQLNLLFKQLAESGKLHL